MASKALARRLSTLFLAVCVVGGAGARDLYLTPDGAGARDGAGWSSAFAQADLRRVVNVVMQPGDRLLVGAGVYREVTLVVSSGGTPGLPKVIRGQEGADDLPRWVSGWSTNAPAKGLTAIRLEAGASHVWFENLQLEGYQIGVHAPITGKAGPRTDLRFRNVSMERFRYGFFLSDCVNVEFDRCDLKRYTKHAFRFDQGCEDVAVRHCTADCSEEDINWEERTESFPFGFFINNAGAPNRRFVFRRCVARNNRMPLQTGKYKNGDGFVVEANAEGVSFEECRAVRNQDGGFDLKVAGVSLRDCVATENYRGFRIWSTGTLTNCMAGWGDAGLWVYGGPVTASVCTFRMLETAAVHLDDAATGEVTLVDCVVSETTRRYLQTGGGRVIQVETGD